MEYKFENESPRTFPRVDNKEIAKIRNLKFSPQQLLGPFQPKLTPSIFECIKLWFIQIKDQSLFQGKIITKQQKYVDEF